MGSARGPIKAASCVREAGLAAGTVAVVIPAYKAVDLIGEAVGSVLAQTWGDW